VRYQTSSKTPLLFYNTLKPTKTVDTDTNGILLVTMDLYSLYTNIPHTEAVSLIVERYQETLVYWHKYNNNLKPVDTNTLKILLEHMLHNCNFGFNNTIFKQYYGTPMGAKC